MPPKKDPLLAYAPFPKVPKHCVVTGSSGFVGQRLVEMLVERGAQKVVAFDVAPKPADAWDRKEIQYVQGDISDKETVMGLMEGAECVWHMAAAVGPYHPIEVYTKVNYEGTVNVLEACKKHGCNKVVYSSSPSTRFDGSDVDGDTEEQMPSIPQKKYLQEYAKTKALGEIAVKVANDDPTNDLLCVAIAPHQVYGPRDNLFMPNMLEAAGQGVLRIFGNGHNRICFSHVDNYCHGLILGYPALYPGSPALGKFYIVTDGRTHDDPRGCCEFWRSLDEAIVYMGFTSIWSKFKLPYYFIMPLAYLCSVIGWILGINIKLNPFTVTVLTMHRWFDISAAENDLKYKPVIHYKQGWAETLAWFKANWLPYYQQGGNNRLAGISKRTEDKIDLSAAGVAATKKKTQ
jgi:nucleoside-diphosphate-sugar epimerase